MAEAGPGERPLEHRGGSRRRVGLSSEEAGRSELKGVPGAWTLDLLAPAAG